MDALRIALILAFFASVYADDSPDGFASVSGNGLTSTTGGAAGKTVTVTTLADLLTYAGSSSPYVILIKDTIKAVPEGTNVTVTSNKTIVGLGTNATLYQGELHLIGVNNVIIRNLTICDSYIEGDYAGKTEDWDGIQADSCHHIWIDHCNLTHNCDGLIDLRKACDYVTVSWVHFSNHNKAFGIGWTTETDFRITIHHCWFDSTNQRNPSFDMGIGHLYNNLVDKVTSYGNYARGSSRVVIENSVFTNTKNPITYDSEATLYVHGCLVNNCTGADSTNSSVKPYNPSDYYGYSLDSTSKVDSIVRTGAGPQEAIGNQYTTIADFQTERITSESRFIKTVSGKNYALTIYASMPGNYIVTVAAVNGRAVGKFEGSEYSRFSCRVPAKGLYMVMMRSKENGQSVQNIKEFIF